MGVQGRSSFLYQTGVCVEQVKQFKTYGEQVELGFVSVGCEWMIPSMLRRCWLN